jgi:predicted phosphodiesterase
VTSPETARRRHDAGGLGIAGLLLTLLLPLLAGAQGAPRVAVISDLNGTYGSTDYAATVDAAVDRILALRPDLVISTGDMVAGQRRPHLERTAVERMWRAFHDRVSERLAEAGVPLAVTPGNHDGSAYPGFALERAIYAEQWTPRRPAVRFLDGDAYPYHYAFAVGDVLFVALDATRVGKLPATQMAWLRRVLARHGQDFRRRVLFSHLPLWPFAHGREREHIGDPVLQALLEEARVDLYLSGHHHAFYPGSKGGVAFVSQACLGAGPRRLLGAPARSDRALTLIDFSHGPPRITAYRAPAFDTAIDWNLLPRRIESSVAELLRADLAGTASTTGGQAGAVQ